MLVVKIILLPIEVLSVINSHNQPKSTADPEDKKTEKCHNVSSPSVLFNTCPNELDDVHIPL